MSRDTRYPLATIVLIFGSLGAGLGLSGCDNTMEGVGDDVEQAADAVEEAGDEAESKVE